jgi:hypothetical protein
MDKPVVTKAASASGGQDVDRLLGAPPLLPGEDGKAYDALLAQVRVAVQPADVIEELWVRDVVDHVWATVRLRRWKADHLKSAAYHGVLELLQHLGLDNPWDMARRWFAGDADAKKQVAARLAKAGLSEDAIAAEGFAAKIDTIERIDRFAMNAEARRNAALRELDRHRAAVAQRLRDAADSAVEGEFTPAAAPKGLPTP